MRWTPETIDKWLTKWRHGFWLARKCMICHDKVWLERHYYRHYGNNEARCRPCHVLEVLSANTPK